ncbi:MAG TPA: hypothetical protein VGR57_11415 [Ktedonobacterales bacterium]|nr:hypothetical protein [Ktedonobacterales bacterium]
MTADNTQTSDARRAATVSRRGVLIGAGGVAGGVAAGAALGSLGGLWRPAPAQAAPADGDAEILRFHTMAPVTGAFVGKTGTPIRGIHGGGLPWAIESADGALSPDGRLRVRVRGLVLAGGPPAIIGTNPIPTFRAIVSFENADPIFSDPVPASATGDADVDTFVSVPHPGFAPILFIGPGTALAWFAVTGIA